MTIAASFTPKPAILSFAITHELLTMRLFLDSLANNNFRMKNTKEPNHSNIDCGRGTGKKLPPQRSQL